MTKALHVPDDADHAVQVVDNLDVPSLLTGAEFDIVAFNDIDGLAVLGAHSKSTGAHNPRATQIIERFSPGFAKVDHVAGPAWVFGLDEQGELGDVPAQVLEFAANLFGVAQPEAV